MSFFPLEYLKEGKVDFVFQLSQYDSIHLIELIRKDANRIEIINGFLSKLIEKLPSFCFSVIYDIPEFMDEAYKLLDIKKVTPDMLNNLLNNSPLGIKVLCENLDSFLSFDTKYFNYIVKYAFETNNKELIHILSRYKNLHIRYLFMEYLIKNHKEQIDIVYDDITKYTTSIIYDIYEQTTFLPYLMDSKDISRLAVLLLKNNRENDYKKLKELILKEYKYNNLAKELLTCKMSDSYKEKCENAFNEDSNILFKTSNDYRLALYLKHKTKLNNEVLDEFADKIKYYLKDGRFCRLEIIYNKGLGTLLEEWTEKYMELSKSREYGFIGDGTTCTCYRIGDYAIKLVNTKWSYEDVICPNLYLIAKNYEEIYLRNEKGIVDGGIEVQKYLTRKATDIDPKYFTYFDLALDKEGYRRTDTLMGGTCGENTMLLDTYKDADCPNPEKVPDWFKECPLVLIDRDRIYPKDKSFIKQLSCGY